MFGNFLYFVIALLIYTTYQPPTRPQLAFYEAFGFFAALSVLFAALTWILFKKLEDRLHKVGAREIEQAFESLLTRQSVLAIGLFAVNIYALELGGYLRGIGVVAMLPTLGALVFLAVFIGYLCIIWAFAYNVHEQLYKTGISRRDYVISNITFSIPVLLPWLCLSAVADAINLLPFQAPKALLNSTEGQIAYFLFFLFIIAIFGPALIQQFWGCQPLQAEAPRRRIENLCRRAGVAYREILIWPIFGGRMITAGVLGLISRFRYILVTPALLRYLSPRETEAVIAHEVGHVKQKHLLFYLVFFAGYLVIAFSMMDLLLYGALYAQIVAGPAGFSEPGSATFVSIVFSAAMIGTFLIYFRFVFGYFMRNFERQADIYIYNLMDSAAPLISTFNKIAASSGQSPEKPNWHHFSISQRINYLRRCEDNRDWILAHHKKIWISITVYLIGLLALGWAGYNLHFGAAGQAVSGKIAEQIIEQQISEDPQNPGLHVMLGDIRYSRDNPDAAVSAYQKALSMEPDNVRALNNLAWLYATEPRESRFFNPEKALVLAKKAAEKSDEPHVLDTLAEGYFVNGQYEKAVAVEKKAMSAAKVNRAHYRRQLEKFRKAARQQELGSGISR
ncbi:MAG: M48 family metalloprotease [Desulfobacteraceae bacterium]|nr:M48 family metalloprotease [Desulfobacteraceae bacterium]